MTFGSDNWASVAPEIMDAIHAANEGPAPAYGNDDITARAKDKINKVFECDAEIFFVATGGAANGLALSTLSPPYGMILCHEESHIQMDECAGPEFFTGGAKLLPIKGFGGKLTPESITTALKGFPDRPPHGAPASLLSITNATECGTVYTPTELKALCATAHKAGLKVHVDGARFANAIQALKCTPADASWKAGVDVLCLGATKNGCLAAEAVIFFDKKKSGNFEFLRKRAGHLWSKQRFISAQFEGWLKDDLWLSLATHANEKARLLSERLSEIDGIDVSYETDINEVFITLPNRCAEKLRQDGYVFYPWITPGDPASGRMHRLITSFQTTDEDIDNFLAAVTRICS